MATSDSNVSLSGKKKKGAYPVAAAAMTALSTSYPFLMLWYFWQDWFKYVGRGTPYMISLLGITIPVNEAMWTILSPWRIVATLLTAKALSVSAKKLREGSVDGKALGVVAILGALVPQAIWFSELSNDWFQGQGTWAIVAGVLALVAGSAGLAAKGALDGFGSLVRSLRGRVLASAVGLGWIGFAAMSLVDHLFQAPTAVLSFFAGAATMPLALLAMVGLFRQRTWGLLAAGGAVGALGATVAGLHGQEILATGRAMDDVFNAVSATPLHAAAAVSIPALVLFALLRPFISGLARGAAGTSDATRVRVSVDAQSNAYEGDERDEDEALAQKRAAR